MKADTAPNGGHNSHFKHINDLVIFENDDWVVLNKPAGMLSIPDRTQSQPSLKDKLIEKYGNIFTVHRLDKDTSGIIVFAKNDITHKHLSLQFEERTTTKIYAGLVPGKIYDTKGIIDVPITEHYALQGAMMTSARGKPSVTEYEVVEQFKSFPLACDPLYGDGKPILLSSFKKKFNLSRSEEEERPLLHRLALHALRLSFTDMNGNIHSYEADLPKDLKALLQQLRKWNQ